MSPKLKTRLVKELLDNLYVRFKYFFSDINLRTVADDTLVRKILSSLQCEVFMPCSVVIRAGQYFNGVYFI